MDRLNRRCFHLPGEPIWGIPIFDPQPCEQQKVAKVSVNRVRRSVLQADEIWFHVFLLRSPVLSLSSSCATQLMAASCPAGFKYASAATSPVAGQADSEVCEDQPSCLTSHLVDRKPA